MGVKWLSTGGSTPYGRRGTSGGEGAGNLASGLLQLALLPEQYRLSRTAASDARRNRKVVLAGAEQERLAIIGQASGLASTQRAAFGASGLEASGLPSLVSLDTLLQGLVEARRADQAGVSRARGIREAGQEARRAASIGLGIAGFQGGLSTVAGAIQLGQS